MGVDCEICCRCDDAELRGFYCSGNKLFDCENFICRYCAKSGDETELDFCDDCKILYEYKKKKNKEKQTEEELRKEHDEHEKITDELNEKIDAFHNEEYYELMKGFLRLGLCYLPVFLCFARNSN